jgi:hypothetical protein
MDQSYSPAEVFLPLAFIAMVLLTIYRGLRIVPQALTNALANSAARGLQGSDENPGSSWFRLKRPRQRPDCPTRRKHFRYPGMHGVLSTSGTPCPASFLEL